MVVGWFLGDFDFWPHEVGIKEGDRNRRQNIPKVHSPRRAVRTFMVAKVGRKRQSLEWIALGGTHSPNLETYAGRPGR